MKLNLRPVAALILAAGCTCTPGFAYEFENAVPLTLGMQLGEPVLNGVHIKIQGHDVEVAISLQNGSRQAQYVGFYAATPLFEQLGEGEEYADKTFADLKAFQDGKPLGISRTARAHFLGQDITPILRKAGISPIPSHLGDWKKKEKLPLLQNVRIRDWQGQVSYGWSAKIAADSTAIETVKYTAMPRFGLEGVDSTKFSRLVQQHCGQPSVVQDMIRRAAPEETEIMAEVFEFPLPFVKQQDTRVTIEKPTKRWQGTRSIAALACGFDGPLALPSDGMIRSVNNSISVLVVSLLYGAPEEESNKP